MAINEVARRRRTVLDYLNRNALFWVTASGAMQSGAIIAMGRSFDQRSPHNVDRVIKIAQDHPAIFSETALRRRKQGEATAPPPWLDDFMRHVCVPGARDFRRLRAHIKKHRRIYDSNYRDLRSKIYAHTEATEEVEVQQIVSRTNVREVERLLPFLMRVHETLWHLFMNGRKPTLRAMARSVKPSGQLTLPSRSLAGVHRRMTRDTEDLLTRIAAQPAVDPTATKAGCVAAGEAQPFGGHTTRGHWGES